MANEQIDYETTRRRIQLHRWCRRYILSCIELFESLDVLEQPHSTNSTTNSLASNLTDSNSITVTS